MTSEPEVFDDAKALEQIQPTLLSKACGGVAMFAGVIAVAVCLQTALSFVLTALVIGFMIPIGGCGVTLVVVGFASMKLRGTATLACTIAAGLLAMASSAWVVVSYSAGMVTLFALGLPALSIAAVTLAGLNVSGAFQADQARKQLHEHGVELGF